MAFSTGGNLLSLLVGQKGESFKAEAVSADKQGKVFAIPQQPRTEMAKQEIIWEMIPGGTAPTTLDVDLIGGFSVDVNGDIVNPVQLDTNNVLTFYSRKIDVGPYPIIGLRKRNHTGVGSTFDANIHR